MSMGPAECRAEHESAQSNHTGESVSLNHYLFHAALHCPQPVGRAHESVRGIPKSQIIKHI